MKNFWIENRKYIGKTLLYQFGGAFFGIMLLTATQAIKNAEWLPQVASYIAILFYLYLIYTLIWDKGGQDRIKYDGGRMNKNLKTGFLISLAANIPNIILAIIIIISYQFKSATVAATIHTVSKGIAILWEGMYTGLVLTYSPNNPIIFALMIIPSLLVSTAAYLMGFNNKKVFGNLFDKKKSEVTK